MREELAGAGGRVGGAGQVGGGGGPGKAYRQSELIESNRGFCGGRKG